MIVVNTGRLFFTAVIGFNLFSFLYRTHIDNRIFYKPCIKIRCILYDILHKCIIKHKSKLNSRASIILMTTCSF